MSSTSAASEARFRTLPCLAGLGLLFVYARLAAIVDFGCQAAREINFATAGEFTFWLAHATIAVPGILLLAYGLAPRVGPWLERVVAAVDRWPASRWRRAGLLYVLALFLLAAAGRHFVLLDLPTTDDEDAARFGGQVLASGQLSVPDFEPPGAFNGAFLYRRAGRIMSFDFPGVLLVAALAELTRSALVYAALAALCGLFVVQAAGLLAGNRGRLLAAALWLCSPMAFTLSMTVHSHLVSRTCIAAAIVFYLRLRQRETPLLADGLGLGIALAIGLLTRPFETATLALAPVVALAVSRRRESAAWRALLAAAAPIVAAGALFAWFNQRSTGVWFVPARFAPGGMHADSWTLMTTDERVAYHLGFNLVLLAIFALGVWGLPLLVAGARRQTAPLLWGVATALGLTLVHDNIGIHVVGPIHYSEAAVPLLLVMVVGARRLLIALRERGVPIVEPALLLAAWAFAGGALFTLSQTRSMALQARAQNLLFETVAAADLHNAIVLSPWPVELWLSRPQTAGLGSWVLHVPHPDPFFRGDVLYARSIADPAELKSRFPTRDLYRLRTQGVGKPFVIERLP